VERRGLARAESSCRERKSLIEKETPPSLSSGNKRRCRLNVEMGTASRRQGVEATAPNDRRSHNNSRVESSFFLPRGGTEMVPLKFPSIHLSVPFPTVTSLSCHDLCHTPD
jgi:hypothetical protein